MIRTLAGIALLALMMVRPLAAQQDGWLEGEVEGGENRELWMEARYELTAGGWMLHFGVPGGPESMIVVVPGEAPRSGVYPVVALPRTESWLETKTVPKNGATGIFRLEDEAQGTLYPFHGGVLWIERVRDGVVDGRLEIVARGVGADGGDRIPIRLVAKFSALPDDLSEVW